MSRLSPQPLHTRLAQGVTPERPLIPRCYTLTHYDYQFTNRRYHRTERWGTPADTQLEGDYGATDHRTDP